MSKSFGHEFWRHLFGRTFLIAVFGAVLVLSRGLSYVKTPEFWWTVGGLEAFVVVGTVLVHFAEAFHRASKD